MTNSNEEGILSKEEFETAEKFAKANAKRFALKIAYALLVCKECFDS